MRVENIRSEELVINLVIWKVTILFILILFFLIGGGFALAEASKKSGLNELLGQKLTLLGALSPEMIVLIVCLMTVMVTQIVSNTATSNILLPVLAELVSLHLS